MTLIRLRPRRHDGNGCRNSDKPIMYWSAGGGNPVSQTSFYACDNFHRISMRHETPPLTLQNNTCTAPVNEMLQIPVLSTGLLPLFISISQRDDLGVAFRFSDSKNQKITLISNLIDAVLCPRHLECDPGTSGDGRRRTLFGRSHGDFTKNPGAQIVSPC